MNILVTGGAGYVGSHVVKTLVESGRHNVCVVDNLSRGHREAVHRSAEFFTCNIGNRDMLCAILSQHDIDCVMHLASYAYVDESMSDPMCYYDNNVKSTIDLLHTLKMKGCRKFIFSSSCAVYGEPMKFPIVEGTRKLPINPYGASKLAIENLLRGLVSCTPDMSCTVLRYFNVIGAAADGSLGEDHQPETHIIPLLLSSVTSGKTFNVFGDDHNTSNGTCYRDYIDVEDIADAHVLACEKMRPGRFETYNVGTGYPRSILNVIGAVQTVTDEQIKVRFVQKRPGDPPTLWCSPEKIKTHLGWQAKRIDISLSIENAWRWKLRHPKGYES